MAHVTPPRKSSAEEPRKSLDPAAWPPLPPKSQFALPLPPSPASSFPPSVLDTRGSGPGKRRGPAQPSYVIWSSFSRRRRSFPRPPEACHQLAFFPRVLSSSDRGVLVIVWAAQVCATGLTLPLLAPAPIAELAPFPLPLRCHSSLQLYLSSIYILLLASTQPILLSRSFYGCKCSIPAAYPLKGGLCRSHCARLPGSPCLDLALLSTEHSVV